MTIRPEASADYLAIRRVNELAFGGAAEANLVEALHKQGFVTISLVAVMDADVVGHVLFSRLQIRSQSDSIEAVALAPVAVLPQFQRSGIGTRLITAGIHECRRLGERIAIVLGEPSFYGRFGFSAKLAEPLASPYSGRYFQAIELVQGALRNLSGTVEYPPPFANV